ncbi:hypothetical protein [Actinocrispum wychmicini]|uniref:Uncharacterized protein n=1 Tax=Actinocrispum wychmicini TaxID=1213861 RepID=A0A4R2JDT7_9PSEU|nr:hypothetical protein [Actinocrispum wychmicini]TCO57104.1 hypothetical protein EV192_106581 [Actinocrispum wychmicini]
MVQPVDGPAGRPQGPPTARAQPVPHDGLGTSTPTDTTPGYVEGQHVQLTTPVSDIPAGCEGRIAKVAVWPRGPVYEVCFSFSAGRQWIWCAEHQITPVADP